MPDPTARPRTTLADKVYHLLFTRISNGEYPVNQRLPPETALSTEVGLRARCCAPRWTGCGPRG